MSLSFNESVVYVVSKHLCSKKKIPESFILSSQYSGRLACCLNAQLLDREVKITPLSWRLMFVLHLLHLYEWWSKPLMLLWVVRVLD